MLTKEQVASVLKAFKAGVNRRDLSSQFEIPYTTVCWIIRNPHPKTGEGTELKQLRHRDSMLRNRIRKAERMLAISKQLIRRMEPSPRKRTMLGVLFAAKFGLSRMETNQLVGVASSAGCRKKLNDENKIILAEMTRYFEQNPGHGFRKIFAAMLKKQPYTRFQMLKVYLAAKLQLDEKYVRTEGKTLAPARVRRPMAVQGALNDMWSMDFMTDVTTDGKRYWILNVVDDFNREALITEAADRRSTLMVVRCLQRLQEAGRTPRAIRSDNGTEFKGLAYIDWAKRAGARRVYIRPGAPTENVLVERFNLTMRREVLDRYLLSSVEEANRMLRDWAVRYNLCRPHNTLGGLSPLQYAALAKKPAV